MTKDSDSDLLTGLTFNCWMKKLKSDAFQLKNKTKNVSYDFDFDHLGLPSKYEHCQSKQVAGSLAIVCEL